jgi:hypothetical protein
MNAFTVFSIIFIIWKPFSMKSSPMNLRKVAHRKLECSIYAGVKKYRVSLTERYLQVPSVRMRASMSNASDADSLRTSGCWSAREHGSCGFVWSKSPAPFNTLLHDFINSYLNTLENPKRLFPKSSSALLFASEHNFAYMGLWSGW